MIQIQNISKTYTNSKNRLILDNINIEIADNKTIAIIGPSGSGKTTLLNLIGTLDQPDSGKILIDNNDISILNREQLSHFRNQHIGFVFQLHHLLPQLSLFENILLPTLANKNLKENKAVERANKLIKRMDLTAVANQYPAQLSGGECQRAAVARALINSPKIILADEPTGALDHKSASNLTKLLLELNEEERVTLIIVTHSLDVAKAMNIVYKIEDGKLTIAE